MSACDNKTDKTVNRLVVKKNYSLSLIEGKSIPAGGPFNPVNAYTLDPLEEFRRLRAARPQPVNVQTPPAVTPEPDRPAPSAMKSSRPRRIQPEELRAACYWFLAHADKVPPEPFHLVPWAQVTNPTRWRQSMTDAAQLALQGRAVRATGLYADIQAFRQLIETKEAGAAPQ